MWEIEFCPYGVGKSHHNGADEVPAHARSAERPLMEEAVLSLRRQTNASLLLITQALDQAAMLVDRVGARGRRGPAISSRRSRPAGRAVAIRNRGRSAPRRNHRAVMVEPARGVPARAEPR